MKFVYAVWIGLLMPAVADAVQIAGTAGTAPRRGAMTGSSATPAAPMLQGTVNSVAANGTSIGINGVQFSSTAMTRVHTATGVATLGAVSIPTGSAVRFMLAALSADGRYHQRPRIAEIWVVQ